MSTSRLLLIAGIAGACGLAAGWYARPPHEVRVPVADTQVDGALSKVDQRLAAMQALSDSMRAQLAAQSQALTAAAAAAPSTTLAPTPEARPAKATPEEVPTNDPVAAFDALERGHALLDRAIARGQWSSEDRQALRGVLAGTDGSGTSELLTALATAINSDKLKPAP